MQRLSGQSAPRSIHLIMVACGIVGAADSAFASGPPIPFDGYSVTNGVISASCPSGAMCTDGVSDNGMLQRYVTISSGPDAGSYIQFILTEPGVTGSAGADPFTGARGNLLFTNEDFVAQSNRADGIASQQRIIESTFLNADTEQRFVNEFQYNYGWAQSATDRWVNNFQRISLIDYSGPTPQEIFYTEADMTDNDTANDLNFRQGISLDDDYGSGLQKTQFNKKVGYLNTFPCNFPTIADCSISLPSGTLTFNQAETITAFWVGQVQQSGGESDQVFGDTRFENLDTLTEISQTSLTDPEAAVWPSEDVGSYTGPLPIPGQYAFNPVDPLSNPLPTVTATPITSPPPGIQPTISAGIGSSDTTVVTIPLAYDGWTVSGGVFALDPCPVDDCGDPIINEGGLMQRIITIDGENYVHTIITGDNATGDPEAPDFAANSLVFKNESLVKMDQFLQGVANRLHIAERNLDYQSVDPGIHVPVQDRIPLPSDGGEFVYNAVVKTGWAHGGPRDPILETNQYVLVEDNATIESTSFYQTFDIKRGETDSDTEMNMLAVVGTDPSSPGIMENPIMFATSIISGAFQNTTHTLADAPVLPSNGGNIAWSPGDALQLTWVGGNYPTHNPNGFSVIDTTSFTNLSTGDRIEITVTDEDDDIVTSVTYDPDPDNWIIPPFPAGSTPDYTDPFNIP